MDLRNAVIYSVIANDDDNDPLQKYLCASNLRMSVFNIVSDLVAELLPLMIIFSLNYKNFRDLERKRVRNMIAETEEECTDDDMDDLKSYAVTVERRESGSLTQTPDNEELKFTTDATNNSGKKPTIKERDDMMIRIRHGFVS